jgi:hypothetical protein
MLCTSSTTLQPMYNYYIQCRTRYIQNLKSPALLLRCGRKRSDRRKGLRFWDAEGERWREEYEFGEWLWGCGVKAGARGSSSTAIPNSYEEKTQQHEDFPTFQNCWYNFEVFHEPNANSESSSPPPRNEVRFTAKLGISLPVFLLPIDGPTSEFWKWRLRCGWKV